MPTGTAALTLTACVAVPAAARAGVNWPSVMPDGQVPWTAAALTMLSASVAVTLKLEATRRAAVESGQFGRIGCAVGVPPPEQTLRAVALLRGSGAPASKSPPLLSVSVQPAFLRSRAELVTVELVAGPTVPSKKFAVPQPTRSTIWADWAVEHGVEPPLQASAAEVLARMPLRAVPDMFDEPLASSVGSAAPTLPPEAILTR